MASVCRGRVVCSCRAIARSHQTNNSAPINVSRPWMLHGLEPDQHARHHQAGQRHEKRVEADSMFVEELGLFSAGATSGQGS